MTLPLFIFEERYKLMTREALEEEKRRFVIILAKSESEQEAEPFHKVGTFVDILSASQNPDGTYHMLVHGQERCLIEQPRGRTVAGPAGQQALFYCRERPYPLERGDPNLERVSAWDTLDTFRTYTKAFFSREMLKDVESSIPEDLVYQASFICANIKVLPEDRQRMLAAPSLRGRFEEAKTLMQNRLEALDSSRESG